MHDLFTTFPHSSRDFPVLVKPKNRIKRKREPDLTEDGLKLSVLNTARG